MLVALKPIYDAVGIKRINVATYQAVSGTGKAAIEELATNSAALERQAWQSRCHPQQIAFNALPHIDSQDNGYTREEMKMVCKTQKILVTIRFQEPYLFACRFSVMLRRYTLRRANDDRGCRASGPHVAPGVEVIDRHEDGGYPTPVTDPLARMQCLWVVSAQIFHIREA